MPEKIATQLKEASQKAGIRPEDFMLVSLQEKLASLDSELTEAMKYVLRKNADLYRRLA